MGNNLDALASDYLDSVIEKMMTYGEQVQFDLPGKGQRPNYQVITSSGRKMAFDSKSLLLKPNENGDVSDNLSAIFTLEQIKAAKSGGRTPGTRSRSAVSSGGVRGSASRAARPAPVVDTIDADKYKYFKENRDFLPEGIQKYSSEISALMKEGKSAEAAFDAIVKQYF